MDEQGDFLTSWAEGLRAEMVASAGGWEKGPGGPGPLVSIISLSLCLLALVPSAGSIHKC